MAGFLDKRARVVDMILTARGRDLLSRGDLSFFYWSAFDDEVDYDPFIHNSGSLDELSYEDRRRELIEGTPVREALPGYRSGNSRAEDHTNALRVIFDMPQGQTLLPSMSASVDTEITLESKQRKMVQTRVVRDSSNNVIVRDGPYELGFEKYDAQEVGFDYSYVPGSFPEEKKTEGFLLRVYESGSEGLREIQAKRDSQNRIAFNSDLEVRAEVK